jgi:hypothetical protein
MARENSGANFRVAVWLRMMLMSLVIATVNDRNDMKPDDHDALGEGSGRGPQVQQIYIHWNGSSWR